MLPVGTRYALTAMGYLAARADRGFCLVGEIARECGLPKSFLAKILQRLARAGLLDSRRGPQGGYRLEAAPERLALADIVRHAADAPEPPCMVEARSCDRRHPCLFHPEVDACETLMWNRFMSTKLSELAAALDARPRGGDHGEA